jgi:Fic family protein
MQAGSHNKRHSREEISFAECEGYKARLDTFRPLPPETAKSLRDYYRIGLTYSSNALEGNSLTESETKVVIEDGLTIGGKPLRDIHEATGHARAYDFLYELTQDKPLQEADILKLHERFYTDIDKPHAGHYRAVRVFISGSRHVLPVPARVPDLMRDFVTWFNQQEGRMHPVKFAALVHLKFVLIHPFVDGNGRVARLLMNLALMRAGYQISIIPPILRSEYIAVLEQGHGTTEPFVRFILNRVIETQRELLRLLGATSPASSGGVNTPFGGVNGSVHGGVKPLRDRILEAIQTKPGINAPMLSSRLAVSLRTTQRHLKTLSDNDLITFKGAPKNGGYFSAGEKPGPDK